MLYLTIPADAIDGTAEIRTDHTGLIARLAVYSLEPGGQLAYEYEGESGQKVTRIETMAAAGEGRVTYVCLDPDDPAPQSVGVGGDSVAHGPDAAEAAPASDAEMRRLAMKPHIEPADG